MRHTGASTTSAVHGVSLPVAYAVASNWIITHIAPLRSSEAYLSKQWTQFLTIHRFGTIVVRDLKDTKRLQTPTSCANCIN
jgi:hypothetical protein